MSKKIITMGLKSTTLFNLFRKDWDAVLLVRLLGIDDSTVDYLYVSVFAVQIWY